MDIWYRIYDILLYNLNLIYLIEYYYKCYIEYIIDSNKYINIQLTPCGNRD